MLLQNQQAGQANQTALQDNLNNNHGAAAAAAAAAGPGPGPGPANTTQSGANTTQPGPQADPQPSSSPGAGGGGEVRSELNWVAQTAAIITEALSPSIQHPPSADPGNGARDASGGQESAGAAEVSVVAEFWMEGGTEGGAAAAAGGAGEGGGGAGGGGGDYPNVVSVEIKTTAGGADPPIRGLQPAEVRPSEAAPPQTDCPSSRSPGTDWDCRAPQQQQSSSQTPS